MATKKATTNEKIQSIALTELYPNPSHPIKMREENSFHETVESIKERGVLVQVIVRPRDDGGYEIIAGRRRKAACELAGLPTIPCIVRNMDDDKATIIMVDSNIQRDDILPSERAETYKMKLEAIKRQGERTDLTSRQDVRKSEAADKVGAETGESGRQIQRYIRLTELSSELQTMMNDKKIATTPAVELSYLKPEEQSMLLVTIDSEQATPSLSQAPRMKKESQAGKLTEDSMLKIMCEQKKPEWDRITIGGKKRRKYFPKNYTPQQIEKTIFKSLEQWYQQKQSAKQEAKTA